MPDKNTSYLEYLERTGGYPNVDLQEEGNKIVQRFQSQQSYAVGFAPVLYLLDYTTKSYIYVDEACYDLFGVTAKQWKEEGLDGYVKKWHPADFEILNNYIFPQNLLFIKEFPFHRYQDIVFSHNYRTLNSKGAYLTILQRSSFIPGKEAGKPLGNLGVAFDITHFKNDVSIVHTIEEIKKDRIGFETNILYKKTYAVEETKKLLISPRELEILKMMAEGLCSKQIACSLNLSINTVNNHRKNMLYKTGCQNASSLLVYATSHGYLPNAN